MMLSSLFSILDQRPVKSAAGFVIPYTAMLENGHIAEAYRTLRENTAVPFAGCLKKEYDITMGTVRLHLGLEEEAVDFITGGDTALTSRRDRVVAYFLERVCGDHAHNAAPALNIEFLTARQTHNLLNRGKASDNPLATKETEEFLEKIAKEHRTKVVAMERPKRTGIVQAFVAPEGVCNETIRVRYSCATTSHTAIVGSATWDISWRRNVYPFASKCHFPYERCVTFEGPPALATTDPVPAAAAPPATTAGPHPGMPGHDDALPPADASLSIAAAAAAAATTADRAADDAGRVSADVEQRVQRACTFIFAAVTDAAKKYVVDAVLLFKMGPGGVLHFLFPHHVRVLGDLAVDRAPRFIVPAQYRSFLRLPKPGSATTNEEDFLDEPSLGCRRAAGHRPVAARAGSGASDPASRGADDGSGGAGAARRGRPRGATAPGSGWALASALGIGAAAPASNDLAGNATMSASAFGQVSSATAMSGAMDPSVSGAFDATFAAGGGAGGTAADRGGGSRTDPALDFNAILASITSDFPTDLPAGSAAAPSDAVRRRLARLRASSPSPSKVPSQRRLRHAARVAAAATRHDGRSAVSDTRGARSSSHRSSSSSHSSSASDSALPLDANGHPDVWGPRPTRHRNRHRERSPAVLTPRQRHEQQEAAERRQRRRCSPTPNAPREHPTAPPDAVARRRTNEHVSQARALLAVMAGTRPLDARLATQLGLSKPQQEYLLSTGGTGRRGGGNNTNTNNNNNSDASNSAAYTQNARAASALAGGPNAARDAAASPPSPSSFVSVSRPRTPAGLGAAPFQTPGPERCVCAAAAAGAARRGGPAARPLPLPRVSRPVVHPPALLARPRDGSDGRPLSPRAILRRERRKRRLAEAARGAATASSAAGTGAEVGALPGDATPNGSDCDFRRSSLLGTNATANQKANHKPPKIGSGHATAKTSRVNTQPPSPKERRGTGPWRAGAGAPRSPTAAGDNGSGPGGLWADFPELAAFTAAAAKGGDGSGEFESEPADGDPAAGLGGDGTGSEVTAGGVGFASPATAGGGGGGGGGGPSAQRFLALLREYDAEDDRVHAPAGAAPLSVERRVALLVQRPAPHAIGGVPSVAVRLAALRDATVRATEFLYGLAYLLGSRALHRVPTFASKTAVAASGGGEVLLFSIPPAEVGPYERKVIALLRGLGCFEQMNTEENIAELLFLLHAGRQQQQAPASLQSGGRPARLSIVGAEGCTSPLAASAPARGGVQFSTAVALPDALYASHAERGANIVVIPTFAVKAIPSAYELQSRIDAFVLGTMRATYLERVEDLVEEMSAAMAGSVRMRQQ